MIQFANLGAFAYRLLIAIGNALQPLVLLAFRLTWGSQFTATGWGKLMNHERVVGFFTGLGIPAPGFNAWFVGGVECFGGFLLLLGLCSRPVALMLAINMIVAYLSVESDRAAFFGVFSDLDAFTSAAPFFFLLTSVIVLAFGPGALSIDRLLSRTLERRQDLTDTVDKASSPQLSQEIASTRDGNTPRVNVG